MLNLLNKSNYVQRISLLNIFIFKIIVQTNLNNKYFSVQIILKFFGFRDFVIGES